MYPQKCKNPSFFFGGGRLNCLTLRKIILLKTVKGFCCLMQEIKNGIDRTHLNCILASLWSAGSHCENSGSSAIPQTGDLLKLSKRNQNHCCAKRTTVSALRKVRKKKRATTSVKKRGRFACKPASGARFSTAKCRSRESDMRMVLGTFCHQKC